MKFPSPVDLIEPILYSRLKYEIESSEGLKFCTSKGSKLENLHNLERIQVEMQKAIMIIARSCTRVVDILKNKYVHRI